MAPSKFEDLGKAARDLVNKNFHFGVVNLEAKTKAANGVSFTTKGLHNTATGVVNGGLETEMKVTDGVTFKEKWGTDNVIASTLTVDGKLVGGLKLDLDTTFTPDSGKKTAVVKAAYSSCDYVHATADVDCNMAGPTIKLSSVFGGIPSLKGFSLGCQASYDTSSSSLVSQNIGFSYADGDFVLHSGVYDSNKYVGSVHHQVTEKLSAGALLNWTSGSSSSAITVAGQYNIDADTFMKVKVDNGLRVGVSYVQKLREGVQVTMSGLLNAKNLNEGGHKVGLSLNFDA